MYRHHDICWRRRWSLLFFRALHLGWIIRSGFGLSLVCRCIFFKVDFMLSRVTRWLSILIQVFMGDGSLHPNFNPRPETASNVTFNNFIQNLYPFLEIGPYWHFYYQHDLKTKPCTAWERPNSRSTSKTWSFIFCCVHPRFVLLLRRCRGQQWNWNWKCTFN